MNQKGNPNFEQRAVELVSQMTLEEKIAQVGVYTPAIPRLGIPAYHYTNEASHGIFLLNYVNSNSYDVTSYPVCLAMSQAWDPEKLKKVTAAISDEARAYSNENGETLNFFCPTINMARDPRNGRSDENFGEDPYLAGKMAVAYIHGLQGEDDTYLKAIATPKHYALNSSENNRATGSSFADEATIREYYAKPFEAAVKEAHPGSIMTAYNRVNGVPCSANEFLLTTLLREEWGFDGFVVSDCGAVQDSYINVFKKQGQGQKAHYYAHDYLEASAMTLEAGTDNSCGSEHRKYLYQALQKGMISEAVIDRAVIRNLLSRFRLGLFDEPEKVPYSGITRQSASNEYTHGLSVEMANDTIVLLKNEKKLLPLQKDKLKKILVVGPNAKFRQLGGYSCGAGNYLIDTPVNIMALDGIQNAVQDAGIDVIYEKGWCTAKDFDGVGGAMRALPGVDITAVYRDMFGIETTAEEIASRFMATDRHAREDLDRAADSEVLFARALKAAETADAVVMVVGTDDHTASEEQDRQTLALPYDQDRRIQEMLRVNSNTIVVLTTVGSVSGEGIDQAHTLLNAHFAGEAQGTAIANILFGNVNPNAKLTATWYKNESDLPHINDYGLKRQDTLDGKTRTYLYFDGEVRFPFGYGLSYTTYEYSNLQIKREQLDANDTLEVTIDVTNTGTVNGKEIIQLYIRKLDQEPNNKPIRQLKAFAKVELKPGETKTVALQVPLKEVSFWSNFHNKMLVEEGRYLVEVGPNSAEFPCSGEFTISGAWDAKLFHVYAVADRYCYAVNETGKIAVSATLEDATHLDMQQICPHFSSMDTNVAAVDETGKITALGSGATVILVSVTVDGVTKSAKIPVAVK